MISAIIMIFLVKTVGNNQTKIKMNMKRNILYLAGVVFLMASCAEEQFKEEIIPTPGKEVMFSAGINGPETKTIYGSEIDASGNEVASNGVAQKIFWVDGDLISVYGEDCAIKQAEYKVGVDDPEQNYVTSLTKTEAAGVQWGETATSDFYAIYPSSDYDEFNGNKITTYINPSQNVVFNTVATPNKLYTTDATGNRVAIPVWESKSFGSDAANPSMPGAIMFAHTQDAPANKVVDLHFKPFSTVFKFRFMGYTSNLTAPTVYVQNIKVTAPEGYALAGDFELTINGTGLDATATATKGTNCTNSININTILPNGKFIPLAPGQALEFDVFAIPMEGQKMGGRISKDANGKNTCEYPWTVTIATQGHGTFTYTILPKTDGEVFELVPGQIHKIRVPNLQINGSIDWDPNKWITQIPVPVYISELSMPGAWYATDPNYQVDTTLSNLYNFGVRAFNIDCRMSKSTPHSTGVGTSKTPLYENTVLTCAGTEKMSGIGAYTPGRTVAQQLRALGKLAASHPDEYVVAVITISEKPHTNSYAVLGERYHGNIDPKEIIPAIKSILDETDTSSPNYIPNLYRGVITPDTTIEDVKGKLIVKINTNYEDLTYSSTSQWKILPKYALTSYGNMTSEAKYIDNGGNISTPGTGYFSKMQKGYMYYEGTDENANITNISSSMMFYYHQAQKTSSTDDFELDKPLKELGSTTPPTLGQRKRAIYEIISKSDSIYSSGNHNSWYQLGIGGSTSDNAAGKVEVANSLNNFVHDMLKDKLSGSNGMTPSPLGIILMNNAANYTDFIKDLIEMNGKFYLNREEGSISTGGSGSGTGSGTGTPQQASATAYVGDDLF